MQLKQLSKWLYVKIRIMLVGRGFLGQAISGAPPSMVPSQKDKVGLGCAGGPLCPSRVSCVVFSTQFICCSST